MSGASKIIDVDKSQVEYLGRQILPVGTLKATFLKNFVFRIRLTTQTYFFGIVACFVTNWQYFKAKQVTEEESLKYIFVG